MKKAWSLSTTVRNAERIEPFLYILSQMEGEKFNESGQVKFQTLLIQNKLYEPIGLTEKLSDYYTESEDRMKFSEAEEIFLFMKRKSKELSKDPGLRGRTSVAPLTKMGLAIAKKSAGEVKITEFGKKFLNKRIDIGDVFFNFFIKWQLPNPLSKSFPKKDGFFIKPFVATLHLIDELNKEWSKLGNEPVGINKDEFSLFAPTLIDFMNIKNQVNKIIEYRKNVRTKKGSERKEYQKDFKQEFAKEFL